LATIAEVFATALRQHEAGGLAEAEALYRRILALDPRHLGALVMLAAIAHQTGHNAEALALVDHAAGFAADQPTVQYGRAVALHGLGRIEEAAAAYERAITLKPDYLEALHNLAALHQNAGRNSQAIQLYRRVLAVNPSFIDAHSNLGVALRDESRFLEAQRCFEEALKIDPDYAEAHNNLGVVLKAQGRLDEAVHHYERALALKPDYIGAHSNILTSLNYRSDGETSLAAHQDWDRRHGRTRAPAVSALPEDRDPDRRLRIGYVSADFREHSVAYFFEPLLAHHDPAAVETYCYANVLKPDATTRRLQGQAQHWRPVERSTEAAIADRIRADRIDILVDLSGHSSGHLLTVFARKPAPIQATWLGYPNTTGLTAMDWRLTDAIADPPGASEPHHTERLAYLPHGFLCYRPPTVAPPVAPLPALAAGFVTFGSFNNLAKVTPAVVSAWADVLRRVADSRLMLKSGAFADAATRRRYAGLFAEAGIAAQRLELLPQNAATDLHLAQYHRVDVALDPFPYNGTTTSCEALWMGVPVLTLAGRRHAGRVGASLLTGLGQGQLIAQDEADYVARAAALAGDLAALAALRAGLRSRLAASALCDGRRFAQDMEAVYRGLWHDYLVRVAA
jgi:predicted O-linked N-acetylglucosamine transferase (SPINDLY family)